MKPHRFINSIAALALVLSSFALTGFIARPSPFVGIWRAIDQGDGSLMRAAIWGPVMGRFFVTWTESYFTFCEGRDGLAVGTGRLDPQNPNILEMEMRLGCFRTGESVRWHQVWQYRPTYDDLVSKDSGVETIWKRLGQPIVPRASFTAYIPGAAEGYDWPMGHTITLRIPEREYTAEAMSEQEPGAPEGETRVLFELWRDNFSLEAGDHVFMADESIGLTKDVVVTNLAVTGFDLSDGTVTGVFDPAYNLWVWLYGEEGQVPATEGDAWTATFAELPPGAWGGATQWDVDGDGTSIDFQVPNPHFSVFPEQEYIEGYEWPNGATVTVSVDDRSACATAGTSSDGFFGAGFPEGCTVTIGDTVTLSDGSTIRTHTVQDLAVTSVDEVGNTVSGTAAFDPDLYSLHAWIHEVDGSYMGVPVEDGAWTADFSSIGLASGMCGRVEINDEYGNGTAVDWCVPEPPPPPPPSNGVIVASVVANWFWVTGYSANSSLAFTIYETVDGAVLSSGPSLANDSGFAFIGPEVHNLTLLPGNYVTVTDGVVEKAVLLELITVDVFDLEQDIMAGTAPPGSAVRVVAANSPDAGDQTTIETMADSEGRWSADFDIDMTDEWRGWSFAQIFDVDGDANEGGPR